jgi:hypothetical protein
MRPEIFTNGACRNADLSRQSERLTSLSNALPIYFRTDRSRGIWTFQVANMLVNRLSGKMLRLWNE